MNTEDAKKKASSLDTRMRRINKLMMKNGQEQEAEKSFREEETKILNLNIFRRADSA